MHWAAAAIAIGAVMAAVSRLRGSSPAAPDAGGWHELTSDDLGGRASTEPAGPLQGSVRSADASDEPDHVETGSDR